MTIPKCEYDVHDPDVVSSIDDLPLWSAPFGLRLLETVELGKNLRVLDIGCGMGFPIVDLSQRLGPTCTVYGIDPWTAAIDRVRMKLRTWGISNVTAEEGRAEALPFPDAHFDRIVSNNGTNNVDDEEQAFSEIARVAKPGAQFVFTVNLPETMVEFYNTYRGVLADRGLEGAVELLDEHIIDKRKPLTHVESVVTGAGFDIRSIHKDEFSFRYTDGAAMLNHFFIKLGFFDGWQAILEPDDVAPVFADVGAALDRAAEKNGELRLTVPWICVDSRKTVGL
jgi:arsenite methyltransferase